MNSDLFPKLVLLVAIITSWMLVDYLHILSTPQPSVRLPSGCFDDWTNDTTTLCSFTTACDRGLMLTDRLNCSMSDHRSGPRVKRPPNLFIDLENAENLRSTDSVPPYPQTTHRAISAGLCEEWFQSLEPLQRLREYINRRIPTSGVSSSVTYRQDSLRQGQLIIYVSASLRSSYLRHITSFNLRRLRVAFDDTFIIVVEVTPDSADHDSADVTIHADFVSPENFYDAAALQEGVLEAFRLFGSRLAHFSGLLLINDSILGPVTADLGTAFAPYLNGEPVLIGFAVWEPHWVSGSGLFFNRAAFEARAFSDYWRIVRFPCGKWGAMLLYEMSLFRHLMNATGMRCLTFSNDISSLQDVPASTWKDRVTTPFFKHKQSDGEAAVLDFIRDFRQGSAPGPLEPCRV